jgi:hypothetical protein
MKQVLLCAAALVTLLALTTAESFGEIVLVNEDFSTGVGAVTGGNAGAGFTAAGGVGTLSGNGTDTFVSFGVENISIPELALGGQLTFQVDNLGGAANNVTRWLQVNVDDVNVFSGRNFGGTNDVALLNHGDVDGAMGTTTIAPGTTELDLLFVTTVDFASTPLPAGEIARAGSFFAEFTPNAIPEPASGTLVLLGTTLLIGIRRRSK